MATDSTPNLPDGARVESAYRAARRGYEIGRIKAALRYAMLTVAVLAFVDSALFGRRALVFLPLAFVVAALTEWRGEYWSKAARRGALSGLASMFLPLSILRPCCGVDAISMGLDCCVMPSACWASGAVVGLAMSLIMPRAPAGKHMQAALGMTLGAVSVTTALCSRLFAGEALGLLGGIAAGILATSLARSVLSRRAHA
jgi:hypothetical protein